MARERDRAVQVAFWILIGLVGFAYAGYPLLLGALVRLVRRRAAADDVTPSVTLLVPAYNEEHSLGAKLESCVALDYPKGQLQILVLSDGSTDGTVAVAKQYADRGVEVLAFEENRGKLAVLRDGVERARGEIVAFSDAACRLEPDSLRRLVRPFADPRVGCVSGVYRVLRPEQAALGSEEGFYWRYETFIKQCESDLASILGAHGSLYAIRRELCPDLSKVRINDDYEVPVHIVAAGHRAVYAPDAVACEEATEMGGFARRVRIAVGNVRQLRLLLHLRFSQGAAARRAAGSGWGARAQRPAAAASALRRAAGGAGPLLRPGSGGLGLRPEARRGPRPPDQAALLLLHGERGVRGGIRAPVVRVGPSDVERPAAECGRRWKRSLTWRP